ncbi:BspA family leucine-rich repeat surface protein [Spiroplasma endosymbiont of Cleonymus obscurus]|uniref:BspA family leucine-rich repeat surface protein n=1 Tax=Spiroplasma endosymbiont of Cleonymus obscurus TaxID=3066324 RepID=UPI0037DCD74E
MKKILTTLSILAITITVRNVNNVNLNSSWQQNVHIINKTQQDTIYIDKDGEQITTNETDLSNINSKEIVQIGFYKNIINQIQVVKMPKTIQKVPDQLPSEITSLKHMFWDAIVFNQDISKWDISKVTDLSLIFQNAIAFNQSLADWNTSNVINMNSMFADALTFNQNISNWNTSNVTNMNKMFFNARSFNQNLSKWNVKKIIEHSNFATGSKIYNPSKLPKFKQ